MNPDAGISAEFERYEGGSKAAEQALIDGLVEKIGLLQQIYKDSKTGRLRRGTHSKGVTCTKAEFEVLDVAAANPGASAEIISRLGQGLYRAPGRYPAGSYVVTYDGEGRLDYWQSARVIELTVAWFARTL